MDIFIAFMLGLMIGGFLGVVIMCMCILAGITDAQDQRMFKERKRKE